MILYDATDINQVQPFGSGTRVLSGSQIPARREKRGVRVRLWAARTGFAIFKS